MLARTLIVAGALAACRPAAPATSPAPDRTALARELEAQFERSAGDWNGGNLDAFLSDYAPDTSTTFVDGYRPRRGLAFIRSVYASRFAPGAHRDSLRFEEFEVRPLGDEHALVTARFILFRDGVTTASGPFTIVMGRRGVGWKILHDHSSSDPR